MQFVEIIPNKEYTGSPLSTVTVARINKSAASSLMKRLSHALPLQLYNVRPQFPINIEFSLTICLSWNI